VLGVFGFHRLVIKYLKNTNVSFNLY
jgi:hypothetical protein